jgi:hypothetical protein
LNVGQRKMTSGAKLILGKIAIGVYLVSALLAIAFTVSLAQFPGGPVSQGYAVIFVLLLIIAFTAVVTIAAVGGWKEKKKIVYIGSVAWPLPILFSAAVVRALFFAR